MIKDVIKHALPMLFKDGKHHVFPTLAELVFGPDGEPLAKGGKWNLPVPDGVVPDTRKINGHALDDDIELGAKDVKARPDDWLPTAEELGLVWRPGDSFVTSTTLYINGFVTGQNNVRISIPLNKPVVATAVTVKNLVVTVRGAQGAFATSESITSLYAYYIDPLGYLTLQFYVSSNAPVNNSPVSVQISSGFTITFSDGVASEAQASEHQSMEDSYESI